MKKTSTYTDLAIGFIEQGIAVISPLIHQVAPDVRLTILIRLQHPDRSVFIDMRKDPVTVTVDSPEKSADVTITADSRIFHYILWGRLSFARAINEKAMLLQRDPMSSLNLPPTGDGRNTSPMVLDNVLYEAYLINRGAAHLLEEKQLPDIFSTENNPQTMDLRPAKRSGLLSAIGRGSAFVMGYAGGLFLPRIKAKVQSAAPVPPPPDTQPIKIDFQQIPPNENGLAPRRLRNALLRPVFSRVDIFELGRAAVGGMKATGNLG